MSMKVPTDRNLRIGLLCETSFRTTEHFCVHNPDGCPEDQGSELSVTLTHNSIFTPLNWNAQ